MTRKFITATGALALFAGLSACGSTGVFDRERPDEFAVTRAKELKVPGEFTLPAPLPEGSNAAAANSDTQNQVLDALFGDNKPSQ